MTSDEIAACLCQKQVLEAQQSNVDVQGGLLQERQQELTNLDTQIKAQAAAHALQRRRSASRCCRT